LKEPLEKIMFLYSEDRVCNIKFVDYGKDLEDYLEDAIFDEDFEEEWIEGDMIDDEDSPYGIYNEYCVLGSPGIQSMSIYIDDFLPLVGFRGTGRKDSSPGIDSLSFIWYDIEECEDNEGNSAAV